MVSYNTKVLDIYSPAEVEKAKNLSVYDSLDADVMQSYLEYSLASMIYYCLKVRKILYAFWQKMVSLIKKFCCALTKVSGFLCLLFSLPIVLTQNL